MATVTCPQCREALDIPDSQLAGPVRCGACQMVFDPPRPAAPEPDDDRRYDDDRPRRRRPTRRGGFPAWLLVLLGGGMLLFCGCCGGFGLVIARLMNPDFQPFDAPDGSFAARFPDGPPTPASPPTGRRNEVGKGFEHSRTMLGQPYETYFAYTVELTPDDHKLPVQKVVDELTDGLKITQAGATQLLRAERMHAGKTGAELIVRHKDGKFTQARVVVAHGKGFVFGVTGPGQPGGAAWVEEFLDGFEIKEPPDLKPAPKPDAKPDAPDKRELAPRPKPPRQED